ncbi:MAG: hypothetical protein GXY06_06220 [Clostridiaceae bacterium]|nr:hypothetical protein [Clostridiaceae bacterium]
MKRVLGICLLIVLLFISSCSSEKKLAQPPDGRYYFSGSGEEAYIEVTDGHFLTFSNIDWGAIEKERFEDFLISSMEESDQYAAMSETEQEAAVTSIRDGFDLTSFFGSGVHDFVLETEESTGEVFFYAPIPEYEGHVFNITIIYEEKENALVLQERAFALESNT